MSALLILSFVTVERLLELWFARRNTKRLLAHGAIEFSPSQYPLIVALHTAWLCGLWLVAWDKTIRLEWLYVFAFLQLLRAWVLLSLGRCWTTRIIILSGSQLVQTGPYRWMKHPNYAVVAGEIAVLPLAFSMPIYALVFSVLNALLLAARIRAENAAWLKASSELPRIWLS